ncbi:MAG TPA: PAS domain S-box protein, partial [Methanobacterium sp.]|nr:PAS domain S-box protein [Methanobacterium sp.]
KLTGFISALEDLDGNVLECTDGVVAIGWQDICLNFHRKHPETLKNCIESGTKICNKLKAGEKQSRHICLNGLVDMAVPIYIGGEHLANLFTGQFFFEPPDVEFFRRQAQPDVEFFRRQAHKYGFDEEEYLKALSKVDVFSEEFIEKGIGFLTDLASVIGEMGLEKKKLLDSKLVLQESEERYRMISQNTGDVIWLLDINSGQFTYVSPSVKNLLGYDYKEALSKTIGDLLTQESYNLVKNGLPVLIASFLSGNESVKITVHQVDQIRKDGSTVNTEMVTTLLTNEEGHVDGVLGVSRDITERKKADELKQKLLENMQRLTEELKVSNEELQDTTEELMVSNEELQATTKELHAANEELRQQGNELIKLNLTLQESKERYRALVENSPDFIFRIDQKLRFLYGNHDFNTLGLSAEELIGKTFKELPLSEEMMDMWIENIDNTITTGETHEIEFEFPSIQGLMFCQAHIIPEYNAEGTIETLLIVNRDITKRKKAEIALKESEKRFRTLINNSNDLIRILDNDKSIIFDSPSSKRILGYPEGYFIGKDPLDFIHPDDLERVNRDLQEVYEKRNPGIPTEFRIKMADGSYIPVESVSQNLIDVPGINGIVVTTHPIIERKKTENILRFQANILNNVRDCVMVYDLQGKIIYWNKGAESIYGYLEKEIIGKNVEILYLNVNKGQFKPDLEQILTSGEYNGEWEGKRKDGSKVYVDVRETVMYDINGKITGVIGVSKDISERKKVEKQIKRSEAYYRTIFENTGTATIIIEEDTTLSLVNAEFEKLYGYPKEEIECKKSWKDFVASDYKNKIEKYHDLRRVDPKLAPRNYEFKFIDIYGNLKDILTTVAVIPGTNKSLISLLDITDTKIAENKLKESLLEKEVLLREIHHRVKNNLQIISSLLNLQTRCVDGEETINVLKESQNRVKTMAMVHEKLYQSENLKGIDFKEYMENLVSDLFYSYGVKMGSIDLQIDADNLDMDIDTAIPCGLVINELVTNSLKYAFPGSNPTKGLIKIELKQLKDKLKLVISDNGIGLSEDWNMENIETLGLKMVTILVNQVGGTLELDRSNGTKFKIIFGELDYKDRI